jgi:MFS family permease
VRPGEGEVTRLGSIRALTAPAIGASGLRAATGFLLFALAFALRRSGEPTWWFGVLAAAGAGGGFLGNVFAPRLPNNIREEAVVVACVVVAGVGAVLAFVAFTLPVLVVFGVVVGVSAELGRLAFQSLMQRMAPGGAHGRVFVRYEVIFQLAWVAGALIPALLPIDFRGAFLILAGLYLVAGVGYLTPDLVARRRA